MEAGRECPVPWSSELKHGANTWSTSGCGHSERRARVELAESPTRFEKGAREAAGRGRDELDVASDHDAQRLLRRPHWIPGCFDSTGVEESVRSPLCLGDLQVKGESNPGGLFHDLLTQEAVRG